MSIAPEKTWTQEELLAMAERPGVELIDGQLVERDVSAESNWIAGRIHRRLGNAGEDAGIGWAFPTDTAFRCFAGQPLTVRKPDAAFIRRERMPDGPPERGHCRVVPDLIVEVVSPNDLAWEIEEKIDVWLQAGVKQVWLVMPRGRTVTIYRPNAEPKRRTAHDELTAEDVIPGFRCVVSDFFPTPMT